MIKLLSISKSNRKNKKLAATFLIKRSNSNINFIKNTHFGDSRYSDYTMHKDKSRKIAYYNRHKNDNLTDPTSAGALSMYILWGPYTNLQKNIKYFRNKFNV